MSAGELRERLTFAQRALTSDGFGNSAGEWEDQFTVAASIVPRRGGEEIAAARLQGRQIALVRVRYSSDTAQITTDWRATNTRTGEEWDVKEPPARMPNDRGYLEFLCERGGVAG